MILRRFTVVTLILWVLSACSHVPRVVSEYKIDIQQGNVLTQDMVSQLRPGLSKDQVRFILGTPMLADMFHASRWDYAYRLQKGSTGEVELRKFTVFFDADNKLVRVGGDVTAATEADVGAAAETRMSELNLGSINTDTQAPPMEEKGFFGRMMEKIGF